MATVTPILRSNEEYDPHAAPAFLDLAHQGMGGLAVRRAQTMRPRPTAAADPRARFVASDLGQQVLFGDLRLDRFQVLKKIPIRELIYAYICTAYPHQARE